jgi:multidrug efflux pump subunit AcrA (membrane-fusion protein)
MKTMNKKIIYLFLTGLLAVLGTTFFYSCNRQLTTTTPQVKPLTEAVYASGFVVTDKEYQVFAQGEGLLVEKLVQEGEPVNKNQPLFVLESPQQSARLGYAREAYQLAKSNYQNNSPVLKEALSALQVTKIKLAFDSTNLVRYQNLFQNKATSKAELDRFKLAYDNSRSEYNAQKNRFAKLKNQLYLDLQNTQSNLAIARDENNHFAIKSQIKGTLLKMLKEPGELVKRGEPIAVVGQLDQFYLRLKVDELDIQRIKGGQSILVKIDAYPNQVFHAKVAKVYPVVDPRDQSLRVDATLLDPLPGYYSGLALEANIMVRQKSKALVIPRTLLLPGDSVEINKNEKARKVKVQKGVETLSEVEIIAGLRPETQLITK